LVPNILSACWESQQVVIQASGDIIFHELELSGFEVIEVRDMFKVDVVQGDNFRVMVEVEETLVPCLELDTQWNTFKIGLKPGYDYRFQKANPHVEVTLPTFTQVEITCKSSSMISVH
jgi:uncharacterized Zn finger protein